MDKGMYTIKAKREEWKSKQRPDLKETWVKGCLIIAEDRKNEMRYCIQPTKGHHLSAFPIDPETICRPIGQEDKEGVSIYEHDLCYITKEDELFEVLWDEVTSRYVLSGDGFVLDFDNIYGYECEVVGNSIDNPELIYQKDLEER